MPFLPFGYGILIIDRAGIIDFVCETPEELDIGVTWQRTNLSTSHVTLIQTIGIIPTCIIFTCYVTQEPYWPLRNPAPIHCTSQTKSWIIKHLCNSECISSAVLPSKRYELTFITKYFSNLCPNRFNRLILMKLLCIMSILSQNLYFISSSHFFSIMLTPDSSLTWFS